MSSPQQHIELPSQEQLDRLLNEQWAQEILPRLPAALEEQARALRALGYANARCAAPPNCCEPYSSMRSVDSPFVGWDAGACSWRSGACRRKRGASASSEPQAGSVGS